MQKNHIDTHAEVNTDVVLEQLENVRDILNGIEGKIDPAPAQYPDTFDQMQIYTAPYLKRATVFYRECLEFKARIDSFMMDWRRMATAMPSKGNRVAWRLTQENLDTAFDDLARGVMDQTQALGAFARYMGLTAAMACDCDHEAMEKALQGDDAVVAGNVAE